MLLLTVIYAVKRVKLRTKRKRFLVKIFFLFLPKYETRGKFDIKRKLSNALDKGANIRNLICPLCRSFGQRQDIKWIFDIMNGRSMYDEFYLIDHDAFLIKEREERCMCI